MFGSGDDKKSPQPAPRADTSEAVDATAHQSTTKPTKKGLFSWFSKKTAEPEATELGAVDPTAAQAPSQVVEAAPNESQPSVVEPLSAPTTPSTETEPTLIEQAVSSANTAQSALESVQPSTALDSELVKPGVAETTAAQPHIDSTASSIEPVRPAYSRFRISGGSDVVVPPVAVETVVELEADMTALDESEPKLDANLGGQDKPQDNKASWFARLKQGLAKTSSSLGEGMASLFLGKKEIDDDLLDELETRLLTADVGMEATTAIMGNLIRRVARKELADSGALYQALQVEMADLLRPIEQPMQIATDKNPYVILVVGVNGAGKTTTIGKLAARLQKEGKKVMLAAGDTFRAAAVEQLQVWGERNKIPVIAQHTGADSASVIFDALQAAKSRGMDVLIADTAGRLHTKDNLMEELRKVGRVMSKLDDSAPHEVLLVLDAGTGQNAINQTRQFNETIPLTGLALTKLDGTAKGGVIFALAKHFEIPVRYIGVGEGIDDLRDFVADDFVKALFAEKDSA
jgi:fused signal recognition particle receptor